MSMGIGGVLDGIGIHRRGQGGIFHSCVRHVGQILVLGQSGALRGGVPNVLVYF